MNTSSFSGKRLKEERKKFGLTQAQIAEKCGVSGRMWGDYERGVSQPKAELLFQFQKAGIDIDYVMHGRVRIGAAMEAAPKIGEAVQDLLPTVSDAEEAELLQLFRRLGSADRHVLKRQAQMLLAVAEQDKKAASAAREVSNG